MNKVLLIEASVDVQTVVRSALKNICEVAIADSLAKARVALAIPIYAMIILDTILPDGNGFDFCQELRADFQFTDVPIMFLSNDSEVEHRLQGFALGADDYMAKPFEPKELTARVAAKLKRRFDSGMQFSKANFLVDLRKQKVFMEGIGGAKEVNLTPIEFRLLIHFLQNEKKVFSRAELVDVVWGGTIHVASHTVDQHISTLRKKMGESGKFLKAVLRKGYCFEIKAGE